ncbi:unnamed protein product [Prorocentrum cordatum]|uniref:Uncharacterized protein n=1 Tax=Prorocentrum cordatum TaxID=2364126 RepID=A0ABN9SSY9_9DINO|nr:unnamed protein product [Polarella glacialis]
MLKISDLCDGSVYILFGCPHRPMFFAIAMVAASAQLMFLYLFWRAADADDEHSDYHHGIEPSCDMPTGQIVCEEVEHNMSSGYLLGLMLLVSIQLPQLIAGVKLLLRRAFLIGGVLVFNTLTASAVTMRYIMATCVTETAILKDIFVLLFIMDVDEYLYKALHFAADETLAAIVDEIDNAARGYAQVAPC